MKTGSNAPAKHILSTLQGFDDETDMTGKSPRPITQRGGAMSFNLTVVLAAFGIGVVAGLRSLTAPAVVAWAAHLGWIDLHNSHLAFLGSTTTVYILSAMALGELVADKLPFTPNRTAALGLGARIISGAVCGAAFCATTGQSVALGAIIGAFGGVAGAFAGYEVRHRIVQRLRVPDFVIALLEDALAIGGGFFLASRF
jgi:uncharacterized membrane protein